MHAALRAVASFLLSLRGLEGSTPATEKEGGFAIFQIVRCICRAGPAKSPADIEICHGLINFCHSRFSSADYSRNDLINISGDPGK